MVKEAIVQALSVKEAEIKMDEKLYDALGVDSTEIVDLKVVLEKKCAVKLEAKEVTKFDSPRNIITLIEQKKAGVLK
jgi:acyl carrier protein